MKDHLGITDQISFHVTKEDRIIRDGKVAILYSPGHGAGWYTWHGHYDLIRDPEVVHLVESREAAPDEEKVYYNEKIEAYCNEKHPGDYWGGIDQLQIAWLDCGDKFRIQEYDGHETIELLTETVWLEA